MITNSNVITYKFDMLPNTSKQYAGILFHSASTTIHQHLDYYEIIFVKSGEFSYTLDGAAGSLPCRSLILVKPKTTHHFTAKDAQSASFHLCIEQHYFEQYVSRVFPDFNLMFLDTPVSRKISQEKSEYLEYLSTRLAENTRPDASIADKILFLCITTYISPNNTLDCNLYIAELLLKLNSLQYIDTSIEELCSDFPYSHAMLLRYFKKRTGMTIVKYRAKQKMLFACQLLTETNDKIVDIATALHYNSLSHFLRLFKDEFGTTPTQYRMEHRSTPPKK